MQIAAQHAEAVGQRAGVSVEEWLLLDGIALRPRHVSPGNVELAASVVADFADAGLALGNGTAVAAGGAAQAVVVEFFDEEGISLVNVGIEDCAEGRHGASTSILPREDGGLSLT